MFAYNCYILFLTLNLYAYELLVNFANNIQI